MKRHTSCKNAPTARLQAKERWTRKWSELPQEKIQAWIQRIPRHIAKVIELEGGNEYCEGRLNVDGRTKEGKRLLKQLKEEMLTQYYQPPVASSSMSSTVSTFSTPTLSRKSSIFSDITQVTPELSISKPLTPPSQRRIQSPLAAQKIPKKSVNRIKKMTRTATSFRPKRGWMLEMKNQIAVNS